MWRLERGRQGGVEAVGKPLVMLGRTGVLRLSWGQPHPSLCEPCSKLAFALQALITWKLERQGKQKQAARSTLLLQPVSRCTPPNWDGNPQVRMARHNKLSRHSLTFTCCICHDNVNMHTGLQTNLGILGWTALIFKMLCTQRSYIFNRTWRL